MQFKDYYQTLGVEPGAGEAEIKTAYRRLARKYHPDVSKEAGAEDKFKAVSEAYEVLRDTAKRAQYDQLRAGGFRPGEEFRPPPGFGGGGGAPHGFEFEFGDDGGGGFSDFFESLFGRMRSGRPGPGGGPAQGPGAHAGHAGHAVHGDVHAKLAIPLELAFTGGKQRINVDGRTLEVKIPAGVRQGQVIRLAGQAGGGRHLLLEVAYRPHPQFEVDGRNILYNLPVAPWEAGLGASVDVPTLGGRVTLRVPAGSDSGRKLRLRGRGLPGQPAGDQIVLLEVRAPKAESDAQKAAYQRMAEAFDFDARQD